MRTPVTVGVVGDTERLPSLVRSFSELPFASLRWVSDERSHLQRSRGAVVGQGARPPDFQTLLEDDELDAVAFSSAAAARGRVLAALEADKHVYIDGPLASTEADAAELVQAAEARDRCLQAQSTPLLGASMDRLRGLVRRGALGEIFYLHATRFVQREEEAADLLWGTGAETVALALDLIGDEPIEVGGSEESYRGLGAPDVFFGELRFATGIALHMHLSSLEGEAVDRLSVVGSQLTAVLDWGARRELSLFASAPGAHAFDDLVVEPGSSLELSLPGEDATRAACVRFVEAARSTGRHEHGRRALTVVSVIERLEQQIRRREGVTPLADSFADEVSTVVELTRR